MPWFEHPLSLPVIIPLAGLYYLAVRLNNLAFERGWRRIRRVTIPVISIGNLSTGGSGKTLVVEALARHLLAMGRRPGILSRGYGRKSRGPAIVSRGVEHPVSVALGGDEPVLLARHLPTCPVVVSEDRYPGARLLSEELAVDCILLDDGFQHRKLHRDLDLVLVDPGVYEQPHVLPWGRLREPLPALERADEILISKAAPGSSHAKHARLEFAYPGHVLDTEHKPVEYDRLSGRLGVFAGLGNPQFFFEAVAREIRKPHGQIRFPDHCAYQRQHLFRISKAGMDVWVTTAKDAVKLSLEFRRQHNVHVLPVNVHLPRKVILAVNQVLGI